MPKKMFKHFTLLSKKSRRGVVRLQEAYSPLSRREGMLRVIFRPLYAPFDQQIAKDLETLTAQSKVHPQLVPILEAGLHKRRAYVFTTILKGESLQTRFEAQFGRNLCFDLEEVVPLLEEIAPVLDTLHAKGGAHGTLKPSNIFWEQGKEKEEIRICDMGMNRLLNTIMQCDDPDYTAHFDKAYISPEQVRGQPDSPAADRYALAVILFYALAGRLPFIQGAVQPQVIQHLFNQPPNIRTLRPTLPSATSLFFKQALAKNPKERFPTVVAMAESLRKALPAPVPLPPPKRQESLAAGNPALVGFIILLALLLVASYFHMT